MRRQGIICLLSGLVCLLGHAGLGRAAAAEDYASLGGSKAMAVIPGNPERYGVTHDQPNDLLASLTALRSCEALRQPTEPACEISRLNDEPITSGAEIRATIPESPHPLYLWRLTGPRATVYLAGSVHILKSSLYPLPAPFEQAFEAADHLVVEVDVGAQDPVALQQKTLSHASLPVGQRIDTVLPAPLLERLAASLQRYGIPLSQVATVKPAFLMNQLVLLRLTALGYQADYGIEQYFLRRTGDRKVLELESIDQQLALLFDQPTSLQIRLLADTLDQEPEIEPLLASMVQAWFAGDDASFMEMFEAQSGDSEPARRFTEQLLDERNVGMARKIRTLLETGAGTYFVLVGTAHLIGEEGIPGLLARQGLAAERLSSDATIVTH